MKRTGARRRRNIHPYISDDVFNRFKKYCSSLGLTESSVVEAALQKFFDGDASDFPLLLKRLDRLQRALGRMERDLAMFAEAFSVFVQIWFAHTPQIDEDEKDASKRQASDRYNQYVDFVATKLTSGHRFIDDMVQFDLTTGLDPKETNDLKEEIPG
jgi:hypothetical protein